MAFLRRLLAPRELPKLDGNYEKSGIEHLVDEAIIQHLHKGHYKEFARGNKTLTPEGVEYLRDQLGWPLPSTYARLGRVLPSFGAKPVPVSEFTTLFRKTAPHLHCTLAVFLHVTECASVDDIYEYVAEQQEDSRRRCVSYYDDLGAFIVTPRTYRLSKIFLSMDCVHR